MMLIRLGIFAVLLMGALSCGTTFLGGPGADGGPSGGSGGSLTDGGPAEEGTIEIYVQGELTPKVFSDGLSGQTPEDYVMGLSRFDLMRSATDPAPVTAFDHGARSVEVDMLGRTLAGTARTAEIQPGFRDRRPRELAPRPPQDRDHDGFRIAPGIPSVSSAEAPFRV